MSHTVYYFFEEVVAPLLKEISWDTNDRLDNFICAIKTAINRYPHHSYAFIKRMIVAMTDDDMGYSLSPDKSVEKLFNIMHEDCVLRKLEYETDVSNRVNVDYTCKGEDV